MHGTLTTTILTVLTLLSLAASVLAVVRLIRPRGIASVRKAQYALLGGCTLGCMSLFIYRALWVHRDWQPLRSHVDGLLLIASLFALLVLFLQSRRGVRGLTTFALPVLTLIMAWSVCASAWTFYLFDIDSVWKTIHLAGVYFGTLFVAVASIAGGMFIYAQRRLRRKPDWRRTKRLASLEAIEGLIVWTSALGFALITLGLVTGVIIVSSGPTRLGTGWWYSPKVVLAASVWLIYALVMNMRYTVNFRGARAAWLSIVGLVLLLATFAVVNALPRTPPNADLSGGVSENSRSWPEVP